MVNIGEFYAAGRNWTLGVSDPKHGIVQTLRLRDQAIATSSPGALRLADDQFHILNPTSAGSPQWSTVSVQAADATSADALSTALCHANASEVQSIIGRTTDNISAICVHQNGSVRTLPT